MSPPHAYTIGVMPSIHQPDDDDDDICPICEGACTCNNKSTRIIAPPLLPPNPRTTSSYASSSRTSIHNPPPPTATHAPLKIKLTVPASLLARARLPTTPIPPTASSSSKKQNGAAHSAEPKRRGRPSKAAATSRAAAFVGALPKTKGKKPFTPKSKAKDTTGKPAKRKNPRRAASDDDYFPIEATPLPVRRGSDDGQTRGHGFHEDEDELDETRSVQFPTFVSAISSSSADESSSSSSSEDSSQLSDFSDSSIEDEEEQFIQAEVQQRVHDKARVKRELLGDGTKWKELRNNWEIQTRKKSVDPSGDEMDVDSDETDDDSEDEQEEAEGNDGEDEEEDDVGLPSAAYAGIATGWSEDEESSFDAELFFAGLTDSESGPDGPEANDGDETVDEDEIDDDAMLELNAMALAARGVFEVTEGWDGSVIFTNGLQDGQGLLDWDFEANAAQLPVGATAFSSSGSGSDTDVRMSDGEGDMGDSEDDDDGLEEVEINDGETTEEELVDDQGLPTARAMRLFRPPTTPLSSVNPMSTMTPGPRTQAADEHRESPKPAEILAGQGYWEEEADDNDSTIAPVSDVASLSLTMSSDRSTPKTPAMGTFSASWGDSLRRAVIDGSRQDVPSPFPRNRRRRLSESVSGRSLSRSRDRSQSLTQPSLALSPSPFGLPTPSDDVFPPTSPDLPPAEPIRLDDVLDASLLDSDPPDLPSTYIASSSTAEADTSAAEDNVRHLQNLSRWDRIPMGTFRRTRQNGLMSDSATELTYGGMLRSSPFSSMWTAEKPPSPSSSPVPRKGKASKKGGKNKMDVVISPVILPVRDGDHTPTGNGNGQGGYTPPHVKPRKESRRDKMLKRKTMMGATAGRRQQQQYHHHGHHPNAKGRASGSVQRGFFGSVPPLNL